jgi:GNAT superfamily N-acetyltransferase
MTHDSTIKLFRQAEDYFFRSISQECLEFAEIAKAYITGVPVASLNPVYIKTKCDITEIIRKTQVFYLNKYPFEIIIPKELCTQDKESALKKLGYVKIVQSTTMVASLMDNIDYDYDDNDFIIQLDQNLKDWMVPMISAFDSTFEITLLYAKTHENALKKGFKLEHFCLYKDKQPISSITLSMQGNSARIDDVGTTHLYQGKGYATNLIKHALCEAKKSGLTYCFLEASNSALSIYKKLGFTPLSKNNIYSKPV